MRTVFVDRRKHRGGREALATALLLSACAAVTTRTNADGSAAAVGQVVAGKQQGPWQYFHAGGQCESTGNFVDDVRDGFWQFFHQNGKPRMAGIFAGDRQVGFWRFWHDNGNLAARGEYQNGREHGAWTFWHENGQLRQRGCFVDGRRTLLWSSFDAEGRLLARGPFDADRPCGTWSHCENGALVRTVTHALPASGTLYVEAWDGGDVARREGYLRDGNPDGAWLTRHRNGEVRAFGPMRAGRPDGPWSFGTEQGSPFAACIVREGRPDGNCTLLDSSGRAASELRVQGSAPWNGAWSDGTRATEAHPLDVVAQWLAEAQSPPTSAPAPLPSTQPAPPAASARANAAAAMERLEAATDPGHFTAREREELATYRRYYRDGFLPRRSGLPSEYGGDAREGLGAGDEGRAAALLGQRLPVTRFPTLDGGELDLDALRGRKVLLVVLRGFTAQVCVYCFAQTAELKDLLPSFAELDCEVIVLFPGQKSRTEAFWAACRREFGDTPPPYRLVYDPDLALGKALGIEGRIVRPASLVLDQAGVVRFAYVAESVSNVADRPPAERLLRAVRRLSGV